MTSRFLRSALLALGLCVLVAAGALAAPAPPLFGPFIDEGVYYQGQTKCSPWAKPGVVGFQRMVLEAYPGTGEGSISRDCSVGGTSEHKEGRAWDWGVNVGVPSEKAAAQDLLGWLAAKDAYGNPAAMARRLGVMYAIWNKRIWFPTTGWRIYCVDRGGVCRDPHDGSARHPHTDHVHFSFTWEGAKKRTTYWNTRRSLAAGASETADGGLVVVGHNGGVRTFGPARFYGAKSSEFLRKEAVAIESRPQADGYWILTKGGRVYGLGAARSRGSAFGVVAADIASTSTGSGYWVLGRSGGIFAFGDATDLPLTSAAVDAPAAAIATTPTGAGFWVVHDTGAVEAYGDAQHLGDAAAAAVDIASTPTGGGYWITTASGEVHAFGDASSFESSPDAGEAAVIAIVPTASGGGYWLIDDKAGVRAYGDAGELGANPSPTAVLSFERILGTITE